jgi:GGDEF domain-containing protein
MKCPKCRHMNPEDARFCNGCGQKLELACPECGKANPPGSRFCNGCGHNLTTPSEPSVLGHSFNEKIDKIQRYLPEGLTDKILAQKDKIEGERKQVTVMFCDMEGFTQFTEKIGPEEAYGVMDQVYEILIHKVHDYEGTVNEMTGDGIMALFGAPIALEDAPQRAIRSALAIQREMAKFSDRIKQVTRVAEQELLSHLSILKDSELLYERGIYPQSTYIFKHALTHEVVYDSMLSKRKKKLHDQIGSVIEELHKDKLDEHYGVLSEHYLASENYEKGAEYSRLAEKKAEKSASLPDAIAHAKKE